MCLPALAAPLAIAAGVTQAAGSIYGGMAANAQSKYESNIAKRNAGMEVEAAHESVLAGLQEKTDFWRKVSQTKGQQIASMAANNIEVGYGNAGLMEQDTEMLSREDALRLNKQIEERTRGHHINAANYIAEAKAARKRGKAALIGGFISGASSLMGGFQQAASIKAKMGTSGG